jgi:hypothetical protein
MSVTALVCARTFEAALIAMFEPDANGTSHTTVPPAFFLVAGLKLSDKGSAASAWAKHSQASAPVHPCRRK